MLTHVQISSSIKIDKVADVTSSGTSDANGSVVDLQGYEGVLFFTTIDTGNAGNLLKVQHGDAANLSDAADLASSRSVANANGMTVATDVFRPQKRYARPVVVRAAATRVGEIYAIRYGAHQRSVANAVANAFAMKQLVSPDAGTA
jgi:hypothetical protein